MSQQREAIQASDKWMVARKVVDEVDGYSKPVAGIDIEAVRTGTGTGPNEVPAAHGDPFTLTSCSVGFPMRSRTYRALFGESPSTTLRTALVS